MTWPEAKAFAHEVCRGWRPTVPIAISQHGEEGARGPYLPRLSAQRPHGDGGASALAAGADGATVSMPLTWAQVSRSRSEALHRPHGAALLRKTKPWADYFDSGRPLEDAIKRLGRTTAAAPGANAM